MLPPSRGAVAAPMCAARTAVSCRGDGTAISNTHLPESGTITAQRGGTNRGPACKEGRACTHKQRLLCNRWLPETTKIEARRTPPQKRKTPRGAGLVPGSAYVRTARGLGESESRQARLACSR